jgi:hypothetical protein
MPPLYEIVRVGKDFEVGAAAAFWRAFPALAVDHYLWLKNGYEPLAEARLCYSERFLYVRFDVQEKRVRARFIRLQNPVYKDSCVEFFGALIFGRSPERARTRPSAYAGDGSGKIV